MWFSWSCYWDYIRNGFFFFSSSFDPFQLIPCNFFSEEKQVLFMHQWISINNAPRQTWSISLCVQGIYIYIIYIWYIYERLDNARFIKGQKSDTDGNVRAFLHAKILNDNIFKISGLCWALVGDENLVWYVKEERVDIPVRKNKKSLFLCSPIFFFFLYFRSHFRWKWLQKHF